MSCSSKATHSTSLCEGTEVRSRRGARSKRREECLGFAMSAALRGKVVFEARRRFETDGGLQGRKRNASSRRSVPAHRPSALLHTRERSSSGCQRANLELGPSVGTFCVGGCDAAPADEQAENDGPVPPSLGSATVRCAKVRLDDSTPCDAYLAKASLRIAPYRYRARSILDVSSYLEAGGPRDGVKTRKGLGRPEYASSACALAWFRKGFKFESRQCPSPG